MLLAIVASLAASCGGGEMSVTDLQKLTVAGITTELPGTPTALTLPIPPEVQAKIVSMESYQVLKRNYLTAITRVTYTPDIEASIDGAIDGSIQNVMAKQQLAKTSEERTPVTVSGMPGKRYSVGLSKGSEQFEMIGVIVAKGPKLWNVFTFLKKGGAKSHDAALRTASAVEIAP